LKRLIKKILKEDQRVRYLNKIAEVMKNDFPLFKNMELYGFWEQISIGEFNYIVSKIFEQPVAKYNYNYVLRNKKGGVIYSEHSDGYWMKHEYDENGNEIYSEDSDGYWIKKEYDENGKLIYWENSNGNWVKYEYDNNGNRIYYENSSNGYWEKREYDDYGNEIYFENSNGYIEGDR